MVLRQSSQELSERNIDKNKQGYEKYFCLFFCALSSIWMFPESHTRLVLLHTGVEVSHPYRCWYLTHTGVGISLIQVLASHPYTQWGLTHRTFRITLLNQEGAWLYINKFLRNDWLNFEKQKFYHFTILPKKRAKCPLLLFRWSVSTPSKPPPKNTVKNGWNAHCFTV